MDPTWSLWLRTFHSILWERGSPPLQLGWRVMNDCVLGCLLFLSSEKKTCKNFTRCLTAWWQYEKVWYSARCCGPKRDLHAQLGLQNLISCLHSSCHHQSSHHYITTSFLLVLINVSNAQGPWWFATRYTAWCCIVITF